MLTAAPQGEHSTWLRNTRKPGAVLSPKEMPDWTEQADRGWRGRGVLGQAKRRLPPHSLGGDLGRLGRQAGV